MRRIFFSSFAVSLLVIGIFTLTRSDLVSDKMFIYEKGTDGEEVEVASIVVPPPKHILTPKPVRAIYMTSWVAGTPNWRRELVKFVEDSELSSIVIDVKDYSGRIAFETHDPVIESIGSEEDRVPDMREFIEELHRKNIYVIARITAFQDPYFSKAYPALAVEDSRGGLWKDKNGITYVDPLSREFWDYLIRIARASERIGFDELNFDYIRYPSDGLMQYIEYPLTKPSFKKADVIEEFFQYLSANLEDVGVPLSADLFGFVTEHEDDLNIGQILERAEPYFNYLAPMVYPSHYPRGFSGYQNPASHPYEIVLQAMQRGSERLRLASSTPAKLRPWIQDFDLGAVYDAAMVKKEKQAVYDAGLDSWMAWDAANRYTRDAY